MTSEEIQQIKDKLNDRDWRLSNLYYIVDKSGRKVLFKLNRAQKFMLENMWFLNLVLKARQRGITTFLAIFFLDAILFNSNQHALIIAHTQRDAQRIFDTKLRFAYDNLPEWLKMQFVVDTDNVNSLKFKTNGSSISVATSGRSGTYQYLHISEFGLICLLYPDKAKEIVTGSLNTAHTGSSLTFIESTAAGKSGYFYEYCMAAINAQKLGKTLTMMDWRFFFFPWFEDEGYVLEGDVVYPKELVDYFHELEVKHKIVLTKEQKNWYVKKKETQKDDMFAEYPSTPEDAFKASIQGAYYAREILKMIEQKRITKVPYEKNLPVHTAWDLGVGDATAIIFFQQYGAQYRIIDSLDSSGEGLEYYIKALREKPYIYGNHYAPHDIQVRELGSGVSRLETAERLGIRFEIVPKMSFEDGVNAVRGKFDVMWIDEEKCPRLIKSLSEYRKEWDDKRGEYKNKPLHDDNSHFADAMRYLCSVGRVVDYASIKIYEDPPEKPMFSDIGI